MFFWNSLAFLMIQRMLAICSLVPLPFLKPRQPIRLPRPWDSPGKNTGVGCHFLLQCMKVKSESEVVQSCTTPSDPIDCSLPGSSVHGIFQARVEKPEIKLPTSAGSSQKQESSRKTPVSAFLTMPKPLDVWTQQGGTLNTRASFGKFCRFHIQLYK